MTAFTPKQEARIREIVRGEAFAIPSQVEFHELIRDYLSKTILLNAERPSSGEAGQQGPQAHQAPTGGEDDPVG